MATANSKAKSKPSKPHKDFPLFAHSNGQWAKKIRGKLHYFGTWDDSRSALDLWLEQKDALLAGRTPRTNRDGLTIRQMINQFLTAKEQLVDSEELSKRSFNDLHSECKRLITFFGSERFADDLEPGDFAEYRAAISKNRAKKTVDNIVNRQRSIFNWAYKNHLLKTPARFGTSFDRPSKEQIRIERNAKGERMFEPEEVRMLLDAASEPLRTMILLAINCGLGNHDIGKLQFSHLDLDDGWLEYPRPKTGIKRRSKLWNETIAAIKGLPEHKRTSEPKDLIFVTRLGNAFAHDDRAESPISKEFRKLLNRLDLYRPGLSFYTLRHVTETVAGESRDQPAVDYLMGHQDASMASNYRQRISEARMIDLANVLHDWLFGAEVTS